MEFENYCTDQVCCSTCYYYQDGLCALTDVYDDRDPDFFACESYEEDF